MVLCENDEWSQKSRKCESYTGPGDVTQNTPNLVLIDGDRVNMNMNIIMKMGSNDGEVRTSPSLLPRLPKIEITKYTPLLTTPHAHNSKSKTYRTNDEIAVELEYEVQQYLLKMKADKMVSEYSYAMLEEEMPAKASLGNMPGFAQTLQLQNRARHLSRYNKTLATSMFPIQNCTWMPVGPINKLDETLRNEGKYTGPPLSCWKKTLRRGNTNRSPLCNHRTYKEIYPMHSTDSHERECQEKQHVVNILIPTVHKTPTTPPKTLIKNVQTVRPIKAPSAPAETIQVATTTTAATMTAAAAATTAAAATITTTATTATTDTEHLQKTASESVQINPRGEKITPVVAHPEHRMSKREKRASMVTKKQDWTPKMDDTLINLVEIHGHKWGIVRNELAACQQLWTSFTKEEKENQKQEQQESVESTPHHLYHHHPDHPLHANFKRIAIIKKMITVGARVFLLQSCYSL